VFAAALAAVQDAEFTVLSQERATGTIGAEKPLLGAAGEALRMTVQLNADLDRRHSGGDRGASHWATRHERATVQVSCEALYGGSRTPDARDPGGDDRVATLPSP
jgi:hypothetical protein